MPKKPQPIPKSLTDCLVNDPVIVEILSRFIDALDSRPMEERGRPPSFRLDKIDLSKSDDLPFTWSLIKDIEQHGWIKVKESKKTKLAGYAPFETNPLIVLTSSAEEYIRSFLNRPVKSSYLAAWRKALTQYPFKGCLDMLESHPIKVDGKSAEEVVERLIMLPELVNASGDRRFYPREVSAFLFWGLSKLLDSRIDAVTRAFDFSDRWVHDKPILIQAHIPEIPRHLLFVENEATYHSFVQRMTKGENIVDAVIWSSGYKASSNRLRNVDNVEIHVTDSTFSNASAWLKEQLSDPDVPFYFFGDLDDEGIGILKSFILTYPDLRAWRKGYEQLLNYATKFGGHTATQGKKERHKKITSTGCDYADTVIIPFLDSEKRYVDQEVFFINSENINPHEKVKLKSKESI